MSSRTPIPIIHGLRGAQTEIAPASDAQVRSEPEARAAQAKGNGEPTPAVAVNHGRETRNTEHARATKASRPPGNEMWRRWIRHAPAVTTSGGGGGGRALLFSYTFPPTGGSGVQRPAKLCKYLGEFGWQVEVLAAGHDRFPWHDPTLSTDIPRHCRVHRVVGHEPACLAARMVSPLRNLPGLDDRRCRWVEDRLYWRLLGMAERMGRGSGESWWVGPASRAAIQRHRERGFDAIISTGPPTFVHLAALRVAQATGLPWVADVRDPLVSDFDRGRPDDAQLDTMRRLEQTVMHEAAVVVTTTKALANDFLERHPVRRPDNTLAITNGFDREDLACALGVDGAEQESAVVSGTQDPAHASTDAYPDACVLAAVGAFYGRRELSGFVTPLAQVLERRPEWRGRVRLVVAGTLDKQQRLLWDRHRPDWLEIEGYLDHASAIRRTAKAACCLFVAPDCYHSRHCIPAKLFELLALPTHLLGLVPSGSETEAIARCAGGATTVPFEQPQQVGAALERIISAYLRGQLENQRNWPVLDTYDRRVVAGRFAEVLARVTRSAGIQKDE